VCSSDSAWYACCCCSVAFSCVFNKLTYHIGRTLHTHTHTHTLCVIICLFVSKQKATVKGVTYVRVVVKGLGPGRLVSTFMTLSIFDVVAVNTRDEF